MLKNPLFRLLFWNWLAGATAAVVLTVGLIASNTVHLRDLIFSSDHPVLTIALMLLGFLVTFCSVAMGTAIMTMPVDEDKDKNGLGAVAVEAKARLLSPVPVPVRVRR